MTPARLHVLTAAAGPAAVILRRGPTRQVAAIGWDRGSGALSVPHWLRGRIYEHRSDLSPDGRHMVYFAGKGGMRWWTALSRAPGLTAIGFWPQTDTWGGGGGFDAAGRLWLNGGRPAGDLPDGLSAAEPLALPPSTDGFHGGATQAARLMLRGWHPAGGEGYDARLWRGLPGGGRLWQGFRIKAAHRSIVSETFAIEFAGGGACQALPDWEWADVWQDRLQFAATGALWEATATPEGLAAPRRIADLTPLRPDWPSASAEPRR